MNQSHKRFVYWVCEAIVLSLPTNFVFGLVSLDGTLRDRGSLLFLLGERREEPLLATARFFDLAAVHGQERINEKNSF